MDRGSAGIPNEWISTALFSAAAVAQIVGIAAWSRVSEEIPRNEDLVPQALFVDDQLVDVWCHNASRRGSGMSATGTSSSEWRSLL